MEKKLYNRLLRLIGEHKINLMSPIGLLDISIATIEVVKAYEIETKPYSTTGTSTFDRISSHLRNCR